MRFVSIIFILILLAGCTSVPAPPKPSVLTITTDLSAATVGEVYAQQLAVTGGTAPYTWSVVSGVLPSGVTLSSSGVVSGIPSSSGSFCFTIQVVDSVTSSTVIQIGGKIDENS